MLPIAIVGSGLALAFMSQRGPQNLVSVRSSKNGKTYRVQNLPDKHDACDRMASIHEKLEKLITNYKDDPASIADPRVQIMVERFNMNNLCENDLNDEGTSYSENKGERIVICLRDKAPPYKLVDENTVMFVILHEMAHLMTTTIGHTPEFWTNFKRILQDATHVGIYTPINYAKYPQSYCGMEITDTPL
jgi:hypothetical protein